MATAPNGGAQGLAGVGGGFTPLLRGDGGIRAARRRGAGLLRERQREVDDAPDIPGPRRRDTARARDRAGEIEAGRWIQIQRSITRGDF